MKRGRAKSGNRRAKKSHVSLVIASLRGQNSSIFIKTISMIIYISNINFILEMDD